MNVLSTEIPGVVVVEPQVFGDSRGWFAEQYNAERYKAAGIDADFVQDNESFSSKGVVRGLHWQAAPHTQAKLVRVVRGAVWDVAVDIRRGSPTFGRHVAVTLSAENHRQLYIPRGFAHGFIVLEDDLGIEWPDLGMELTLSDKDRRHPLFKDILPWSEG